MARCDSYPVGECTYGACHLTSYVGDWWGDADQWIRTARDQGFETTITPTVGAVVVYGPGGFYSDVGHVGVVVRVYDSTHFEVEEMNYSYFNRFDTRNSNLSGVEGFILPPGVAAGTGGSGPPVARADNLSYLGQSWGWFQNLWNQDIDNYVNARYGVSERLKMILKK